MMIGVYGVVAGMSPWWPPIAFSTASVSLNFRQELHPDRRVAALLVVVHRLADVVQQPARRASVPSRPSSSAIICDKNATSIECRSTFCP